MGKKAAPPPNTFLGRFGSIVRRYREAAGLSVNDLAEAMGIWPGSVYKWEAGGSAPPLADLPKLAEVLGVKVRSLLPRE